MFEGTNDTLLKDQILIIDNERIVFSGGSSNAPPPQKNDEIIDLEVDKNKRQRISIYHSTTVSYTHLTLPTNREV